MHEVIVKSLRPFRWHIFFMFMVAILWAIDMSLTSYLLKVIINRLQRCSRESVWQCLALPVYTYVGADVTISMMFRVYGYLIDIKMIPALRKDLGESVFRHLLKHSHRYYQNQFAGSLANKVNDLTTHVPDLLVVGINRFFSRGMALIISIFTLWQSGFVFGLLMMSWATVFLVVALLWGKQLSVLADYWSQIGSRITGQIVDSLSNVLSVRLFARQHNEWGRLSKSWNEARAAERKLESKFLSMWVIYGLCTTCFQIANFYFLLKGYRAGSILPGDFALVLGLSVAIVAILWELGEQVSQFSSALGKVRQALRVTMDPIEMQDEPAAKELKITKGEIVFEGVHFQYPGSEPIFENKSILIRAGQKVGLVGYSGSGKSTFVNLILRLFDVSSGRILIDGQDIRSVTQDSLRNVIAMIPQEPLLFHRSLLENIGYGQEDASETEIIRAAERAHAHDFIVALPEGYATLVGERGVKLSGGQRQRIAIARAILKNAPILMLDEATSQLDSVVERAIQETLWSLMQGKTTLVIAHRLSTLLHMDRILVFHQGLIVEDGTHAALLRNGGLYQKLWTAQVGGFLGDRHMSAA